MRSSLIYCIFAWFSAISFSNSFFYKFFSCWIFLISIFKFFSFSKSFLRRSWFSSSWVMKVLNFWVVLFLINYTKIKAEILNSYNLTIRLLRSLVTLNESLSKSGFYLKSLHNFLVLYLRIIERLAISISIY